MSTKNVLKGYEFITTENGERKAISLATGEITDVITREMPVGTISYTPEQQEQYKERRKHDLERLELERKNKKKYRRNSPLGNYFFTKTLNEFDELTNETVARLVYLITFMDYQNRLMINHAKQMNKKDIAKVLGVSSSTALRFWSEVSPKYIRESVCGLIVTDDTTFLKGKITNNTSLMQCYIDGIRKLYEQSEKSKHKYLGYIFKMLPYVHTEYNILCRNPYEDDLSKIEALNIKDFCKIINYDVTRYHKLKRIYKDILFKISDNKGTHSERFCSFVDDGIHHSKAMMIINPRIFYVGDDFKAVKIMGEFMKPL